MSLGGMLGMGGAAASAAPVGAGGIGGLLSGLGSAGLPMIIALLGSIFGGEEDEELEMYKRMQMMKKMMGGMGMQPPYQSPHLSQLDPVVAQALMNNMGRYANFGFPEGMQMPAGFLDNLPSFMAGQGGAPTGRRIRP